MYDIIRAGTIFAKNRLVVSERQLNLLLNYCDLLREWNQRINLISRKDEENIFERHILASLSFLFKFQFNAGSDILDLGTGGGLPGIPLAILCQNNHFTLLDSIHKKIGVVGEMIDALNLPNVSARTGRAEELSGKNEYSQKFDYVISRAVASVLEVAKWSKPFLRPGVRNPEPMAERSGEKGTIAQGSIILYKGGDLSGEIGEAERKLKPAGITVCNLIIDGIDESHFHDKKLLFIYP